MPFGGEVVEARAGDVSVAVHAEIAPEVVPMHDQHVVSSRLGHWASFPVSSVHRTRCQADSATLWLTESNLSTGAVFIHRLGWWGGVSSQMRLGSMSMDRMQRIVQRQWNRRRILWHRHPQAGGPVRRMSGSTHGHGANGGSGSRVAAARFRAWLWVAGQLVDRDSSPPSPADLPVAVAAHTAARVSTRWCDGHGGDRRTATAATAIGPWRVDAHGWAFTAVERNSAPANRIGSGFSNQHCHSGASMFECRRAGRPMPRAAGPVLLRSCAELKTGLLKCGRSLRPR